MSSNDKNCLRLSNNSDDIYPLMTTLFAWCIHDLTLVSLGIFTCHPMPLQTDHDRGES